MQASWDLLNEKIEIIHQAEAVENNRALQFQYQRQFLHENAALKQIENELDTIEQELSE